MADVSVVIPCYNGQRYIGQTIESVLAQTDVPREVFVIDDGSTDDSVSVIEKFVGSSEAVGITLIRQANAGESRARNVGMERATCTYIAFLDADDVWLPEKTARQLEAFERYPDAVAVHSRMFNFEKDLDDCGREETEATKDDPSVEDLINYHYVTPSAAMVRRDAIKEHGLRFEEAVRHSEDMLFFADVRLAGSIRLVDEPLTAKRTHPGQQTKDPWHTIYSLESRADWCCSRAGALGEELRKRLDTVLGKRMIDVLEDRYWRRQFDDLKKMWARVRERYPAMGAKSLLAKKKIYPRWTYHLRDALRKRP